MAKGKSLNPADAQRKAERKKELKKNKTERQKNRDFALVKKDTTSIEEDLQRLEKAETDGVISGAQKIELSSLRAELARINKKKDEWVSEHPEHRKLVYRARYKKSDQEAEGEEGGHKIKERKVFDKNGIPRHPERSVYYDPVMNPFGVPPPGMPYMERPLQPDEVDSQAEDGSDESEGVSDDEIAMPSGPPPSAKPDNDIEDSDDEIPMPEGPPPSQLPHIPPPPPPPPPSGSFLPQSHTYQPPPRGFLPPPPPPPPPGFPAVPPIGFPSFPPYSTPHMVPPPPAGFPVPPPHSGIGRHSPGWTNHPSSSRSRLQSNGAMQDPLTSLPHQTFQAYRAQQGNMSHPLPDKPTQGMTTNQVSSAQSSTQSTSSTESGIISAPAQLRDLKKESTSFVPSSLKRKKAGGMSNTSGKSSASRINAAPEANDADKASGHGEAEAARPDLLGALKTNFPAPITKSGTDDARVKKRKLEVPEITKGKDDYEKFIEEIGDIL